MSSLFGSVYMYICLAGTGYLCAADRYSRMKTLPSQHPIPACSPPLPQDFPSSSSPMSLEYKGDNC